MTCSFGAPVKHSEMCWKSTSQTVSRVGRTTTFLAYRAILPKDILHTEYNQFARTQRRNFTWSWNKAAIMKHSKADSTWDVISQPLKQFLPCKKNHAKTNQHLNLKGKYGRACSYWMDLLTLLHTGKYMSWVCTSLEQHSVQPKFVVLHRGGIIQWWLHPSASAEFHFRP